MLDRGNPMGHSLHKRHSLALGAVDYVLEGRHDSRHHQCDLLIGVG
jgi:hypothetical protein